MFDKIEAEIEKECSLCKNTCKGIDCLAYRIKEIMTVSDIEVSEININDFFEEESKEQMTIFDLMENPE